MKYIFLNIGADFFTPLNQGWGEYNDPPPSLVVFILYSKNPLDDQKPETLCCGYPYTHIVLRLLGLKYASPGFVDVQNKKYTECGSRSY